MHTGTYEVEGEVTESLPNTMFRVRVTRSNDLAMVGTLILTHLSGKMRMNYVRVLPGDRVRVEMTAYDKTKGRITFRLK